MTGKRSPILQSLTFSLKNSRVFVVTILFRYAPNNSKNGNLSMAYCPKCNAKMEPMDTACAQCGYDFPSGADWDRRRDWIFYTDMANVILTSAIVICIIAAIIFGIGAVVTIAQFHVPHFLLYLAASICAYPRF